jgi:glucose-1-phosphate adenylyltransferase
MKNTAAFVLAGGRVTDTGALTHRRAKAALPFSGHYRIIDFALSNLAVSGVDRVGVLCQFRPMSLMAHIGNGESWGLVGRGREVAVLSPFQSEGEVDWYHGTADAVRHNLHFLGDAENVLIVSGDHIYRMDYNRILDAHRASHADLTMVFKHLPGSDLSRFGNARIDDSMRVLQYVEKPEKPLSDLGSLTIYLFKRTVLERYLQRAFETKKDNYHLAVDVIPPVVQEGKVQAVLLEDYWAFAHSVDTFFESCMDLLRPEAGLRMNEWEVLTNFERSGIGDVPPAFIGAGASVEDSRFSPGCRVLGNVTGSILSPGVIVEEGATVVDSVLMHGVTVDKGAALTRVIADKHTRIGAGAVCGVRECAVANTRFPDLHRSGVTVIGRECHVGAGATVGGNCQLFPGTGLPAGASLPDGQTVLDGGAQS